MFHATVSKCCVLAPSGTWYDGFKNSKAPSTRELKAKLKFAKNKLKERLALTEEALKGSEVAPADVILPVVGGSADVSREQRAEIGSGGDGVSEKKEESGGAELEKRSGAVSQQEMGNGSGPKVPDGLEAPIESVQSTKGETAIKGNGTSSGFLGVAATAVAAGENKKGPVELPRLEALARKLGLDDFEKGVVTMLTGVAISPVVKSIYEADDGGGSYRRTSDTVQVGIRLSLRVFFQLAYPAFLSLLLLRRHIRTKTYAIVDGAYRTNGRFRHFPGRIINQMFIDLSAWALLDFR